MRRHYNFTEFYDDGMIISLVSLIKEGSVSERKKKIFTEITLAR